VQAAIAVDAGRRGGCGARPARPGPVCR